MTNHEVLLGKLTRRQFRERMDQGHLACCIIPVGAIEQHLEHLCMEHDWRSVNHVAVAVAQRLQPQVVVTQGLMAGISEHHMTHKGTLSLRPATFLAALEDLIDSMVRAGFKQILVLNGHGGNVAVCQAAWDQLLRRFQVNLHFLPYWDVLDQNDARQFLTSGHQLPDHLPGHAEEFETAFALAAFPENVDQKALAGQANPHLTAATADNGQALIDRVVDRVSDYVREMISGKRHLPVPPYYP